MHVCVCECVCTLRAIHNVDKTPYRRWRCAENTGLDARFGCVHLRRSAVGGLLCISVICHATLLPRLSADRLVCVCVCVRARAWSCVRACVCVRARARACMLTACGGACASHTCTYLISSSTIAASASCRRQLLSAGCLCGSLATVSDARFSLSGPDAACSCQHVSSLLSLVWRRRQAIRESGGSTSAIRASSARP